MIAGASIAAALNGLEYAAIHKYDLFTKLHIITGSKVVSSRHYYSIVIIALFVNIYFTSAQSLCLRVVIIEL